MSQVRQPRTDDRPLQDVFFRLHGYQAVVVAHELKLFPLLAEKPRTLDEICKELKLAPRPVEALLTVSAALGLLQLQGRSYALTPLAEDYLLESSPTYLGWLLDRLIATDSVRSFASVKKAVLTNTPQVYGGADLFKSHEEQSALARAFTRAMHSSSMGAALVWPELLDLAGHRRILDIGGGSGAHAIGATLRWPNLHATILDLAPVCEVAAEFSAHYHLQDRITMHVSDMWQDPFPAADIHFYSQIYHDWPSEQCRFLTRKSFESLESGGRIIIHEMLYNDDKTGPFTVASASILMLLRTQGGKQYSGPELSAMLEEEGFADISTKPAFGYYSIVAGRKP